MRKILITLITAWAGFIPANGQQNVTLYHMTTAPQQLYANPSFIPDANTFVGIPGLSSHQFNLAFSRLSFDDFLNAIEKPTPDSSVLNINKLTNVFDDNNYLGLQYNFDILHFGFKVNNSYITANLSVHNNLQMNVPKDLIDFLLNGNGGQNLGKEFDFGFGLDLLQYTELGLGYATKLMDDRLSVGSRVRFIKGLAALETERNDISFYTDPNDFTLKVKSDVRFNMANSYSDIADTNNHDPQWGMPGSPAGFFNSSNNGFGLDLGVKYELNEKIDLSAAINNIGYINWNKHSRNYFSAHPNQYIEFEGVDYKAIFDTTGSFRDAFEQIGDSIKEQLALDSNYQSFQTNLRPEFYIGGTFAVAENHKAGILFYGSFYQHRLYPAFTLSWNSKLSKVLGLSLSYTSIHGTYFNIGFGTTVNAGPVQFYFVSDNLFGAFNPLSSSVVNFRGGINLTFGRGEKEDEAAAF